MPRREYAHIELYLQAIAFAHNTTFSSALNCTPFEAGHGLSARSISDARLFPRMQLSVELRGNEEDCVTQWDTTVPYKVLELAARFAYDAVKHSEWHRKMTADNSTNLENQSTTICCKMAWKYTSTNHPHKMRSSEEVER